MFLTAWIPRLKCRLALEPLRQLQATRFSSSLNPRKFFVGGNMKMNGSKEGIEKMAKALCEARCSDEAEIVIAPPSPFLEFARIYLPETIGVAAQNCYKESKGPYTGEISPEMLLETGATWVILGHSERRSIFKESDELIAQKIQKCLDSKLNVIACIGENLQERKKGTTMEVIIKQLSFIISQVANWKNVVIAYEPVWAIGTGKVATPDQVQEVHCNIRSHIKKKVCSEAARICRIVYGGSVTSQSAVTIAKSVDVDGFLVGGACLKPEFTKIIQTAKEKRKPCD